MAAALYADLCSVQQLQGTELTVNSSVRNSNACGAGKLNVGKLY